MTQDEVELLQKLTIVIPIYIVPTLNRRREFELAIEYWRETPIVVHILDGSAESIFRDGQILGVENIYYHHMPTLPGENPTLNVMKRLVFASTLPKTKYSAVCSADDFFTISGLVESIKYLENNIEVDAAVGSSLNYFLRRKKLFWYFFHDFKKNYGKLETKSIKEKVFLRKTWFLYAVCRTSIWCEYIKLSYEEREFTATQYFAHEWIMFILSKGMFRTKQLDLISIIRQDLIVGANKGPSIAWGDWINNPNNFYLVDEIVDQLSRGFNFVSDPVEHKRNLQLARSLMLNDQQNWKATVITSRTIRQKFRKSFSNAVYVAIPNLKIFADRAQLLKNQWKLLDSTGLFYVKSELQDINNLLAKPREKLRLRIDC